MRRQMVTTMYNKKKCEEIYSVMYSVNDIYILRKKIRAGIEVLTLTISQLTAINNFNTHTKFSWQECSPLSGTLSLSRGMMGTFVTFLSPLLKNRHFTFLKSGFRILQYGTLPSLCSVKMFTEHCKQEFL